VCAAETEADGGVSVDLTNATVGGTDCPALDFVSSLDEAVTLRHTLGTNAIGSYTVDVDVDVDRSDEVYEEIGSGEHPYERPILYDATVQLDVVRPSFTYSTSVTAAGGDRDD
jgi:hypothetical protein